MGGIRLGCVILDLLRYTSWIREIPPLQHGAEWGCFQW